LQNLGALGIERADLVQYLLRRAMYDLLVTVGIFDREIENLLVDGSHITLVFLAQEVIDNNAAGTRFSHLRPEPAHSKTYPYC
jgi:hypothetical protein